MAANNAISEEAETNGGIEVVKKFNVNFGNLKLNDSKKRIRGGISSGGTNNLYTNQNNNQNIID